jgi:secondary thiamine-phosphate synthase enzyme
MIFNHWIHVQTRQQGEVIDLSDHVRKIVETSIIHNGHILLFIPGSTAALSTIEYEPGLIRDLPEFLETIVPESKKYYHNETWHDGNGHSHIKATLIGPSLIIPIAEKKIVTGTWQQIVLLEFDNRPRERKVFAQLMGE